MLQQQAQKFEFLVRQRHILAADLDLVAVRRDEEQAERKIAARLCGLCPAQDRADARDELEHGEGLGNKIVRPVDETDDAVILRIFRGQHDDGHLGKLPDRLADLKPVVAGQHHIQEHHIVLPFLRLFDRLVSIICEVYFHSILFQTEPDALYDQFFIVNNQNSCHFLLHSNCYPVFYLLKTSILDARDLHDIFYLFKASEFVPVTDDILRL